MTPAIEAAGRPLRLGSPEEFQRVRDFLLQADFTEEVLCRGLKLEALNQLGRVEWDKVVLEA